MASAPSQRRLAVTSAHIGGAAPEPAAGVVAWLRGLLQGDEEKTDGGSSSSSEAAAAVAGVVRQCYVADEDWPGAEVQSAPDFAGHYFRQNVEAITVAATPGMEIICPSHREGATRLADPNERALMMTTAEGYEQLRAALPHAAGTLSHERPGSGENFYVDGLAQTELCLGDVLAVGGAQLEVASPRRPCAKWNKVHNMEAFLHGDPKGNVQHFALTHGLGGVYLRIKQPGEIKIGASISLLARPHPQWTLGRVADLVYGNATVHPSTGIAEQKGEAWSGTDAELMELISMPVPQ